MSVINSQKAYLVLQDGTVFEGNAIGKIGTTTGEIAFNTGMTGYQEVFTDPSYFGQIVVMTISPVVVPILPIAFPLKTVPSCSTK